MLGHTLELLNARGFERHAKVVDALRRSNCFSTPTSLWPIPPTCGSWTSAKPPTFAACGPNSTSAWRWWPRKQSPQRHGCWPVHGNGVEPSGPAPLLLARDHRFRDRVPLSGWWIFPPAAPERCPKDLERTHQGHPRHLKDLRSCLRKPKDAKLSFYLSKTMLLGAKIETCLSKGTGSAFQFENTDQHFKPCN